MSYSPRKPKGRFSMMASRIRSLVLQSTAAIALLLSACAQGSSPNDAGSEDQGGPAGRLLFTDGKPSDIWIMDAGNGQRTRITDTPVNETAPTWSPDNSLIAFEVEEDRGSLFVMRSDGTGRRRLIAERYIGPSSWSPDSSTLTYVAGGGADPSWDIYTVQVRSGTTLRLTENRLGDFSPSWSPDGRLIAFSRNGTHTGHSADIYVVEPSGGQERRLTNTTRFESDAEPVWSPDGGHLAFVRVADTNHIHVVDLAGNARRLTAVGDLFLGRVAWSPDGTQIAYFDEQGISLIEPGGQHPRIRLTPSPAESHDDAMPTLDLGVMWSPDGSGLLYARTSSARLVGGSGPIDVYVMTVDGEAQARKLVRLRGINAELSDWR